MAVFIEKPPVTSSDCYENIKKASILFKLGKNVDRTIAFVTANPTVSFMLPWQRGVSKLPIFTVLHCVFFVVVFFQQN
jgi:hypothetical protein